MRAIKFRGISLETDDWVYGYLADGNLICTWDNSRNANEVLSTTVGQFTGLIDKNGKAIYEGDIIKWYEIGHSDHDVLEPPEDYIKECVEVVEFSGGCFGVSREDAPSPIPVAFLTKDFQANEDDMFKWVYNTDEYPNITADDMYICEVVGNVFDNPELLGEE